MATIKFITVKRAPAPNRLRLEGLACINSKKWNKGALAKDYNSARSVSTTKRSRHA
jgi:hypothetical protein